MNALRPTLLAAALMFTMAGGLASAQNADTLPRAKVTLVAPPLVHPHEQVASRDPRLSNSP